MNSPRLKNSNNGSNASPSFSYCRSISSQPNAKNLPRTVTPAILGIAAAALVQRAVYLSAGAAAAAAAARQDEEEEEVWRREKEGNAEVATGGVELPE